MMLWEIRDLAREITDTQDDVYISQSRLDVWINMAYRHIYQKVVDLSEDYFLTSTTFSTSTSIDTYSLPSDMMQLRRVEKYQSGNDSVLNLELWPQDLNDLRDNTFPERYILQGNNMRIIPTPSQGDVIKLDYIPTITTLSASSDEPATPSDHHEIIAYYAALQIKVKEESDANGIRVIYGDLLDQLMQTLEARQTQRSRQIRYTEDYE